MFNKAFLESHLAKQVDARKTQLENIKLNRPAFPPPTIKITQTPTPEITTNSPSQNKNFISLTKADDLEEYWDDDEVIVQKSKLLAQYIKDAQHCVVFTGAGISTAAKLPEYLLNYGG
jgi:hypothetical protein